MAKEKSKLKGTNDVMKSETLKKIKRKTLDEAIYLEPVKTKKRKHHSASDGKFLDERRKKFGA